MTADRYAVAGNPVEHSRSPLIHSLFAQATGQSVDYGRLLCPLDAFKPTLLAFAAGGAKGCNVTVPFKFEAFEMAARRSPRAELAQAANTLRFDGEGGWLADNCSPGTMRLVKESDANQLDVGEDVFVPEGIWTGHLSQTDRAYEFYYELNLQPDGKWPR